ncbi:hypothetical protein RI367_007414 [Sorochytrium milnesiophthora]
MSYADVIYSATSRAARAQQSLMSPTSGFCPSLHPHAVEPDTTRARSRLTREQTAVLKRVYTDTFFPDKSVKEQLARELGIPVRTVQIWFQNQRQYHRLKLRKKANKEQQASPLSLEQQQFPLTPHQSPAIQYPMSPEAGLYTPQPADLALTAPATPASVVELNTTAATAATATASNRRYSAPAKYDPYMSTEALDYFTIQGDGQPLPCSPILETAYSTGDSGTYHTPLPTSVSLPEQWQYTPDMSVAFPLHYYQQQSPVMYEASPPTPLFTPMSEQSMHAYTTAYTAGVLYSPELSQSSLPESTPLLLSAPLDFGHQSPQLHQQQLPQLPFSTLMSALPTTPLLSLVDPTHSPPAQHSPLMQPL